MKSVDDARRAWEAAERLQNVLRDTGTYEADAKLLLTNAEAEYRAALVDERLRKFDALGIKVGETRVCIPSKEFYAAKEYIIERLEADVEAGAVKARYANGLGWDWAHELRPYAAPDAKQMVLHSSEARHVWGAKQAANDTHRLTLSNVTPADLNAMKPGDVIEGTFKIEGVGK